MWILYIIAALALLILLALATPVRIIIKSDPSGEPQFLFKVFFFTFGKSKKKKGKRSEKAKNELGVDTFSLKNVKQQIKEKGLKETVSQILHILTDIIKAAVKLLHHCTAEKFEFKVVVTGDDAAVAAIKYGACCAAIYPLIGAIGSVITLKEKHTKIDVLCNYGQAEEKISYNFVIKVRVFRVIAAFCRFLWAQYKRKAEKENQNPPKPKDIVS